MDQAINGRNESGEEDDKKKPNLPLIRDNRYFWCLAF